MKLRLFISLILLTTFLQCQKRIDPKDIIQHVKNQFVPDARTGIFSIEAQIQQTNILLTGETDNKDAHTALIKKFTEAGYSIIDSTKLLPLPFSTPWALVSLSAANMRINPSHDAEMVTQALMGTPVKILKETEDWVLAQTPDKYIAWCEKDAICRISEDSFKKWKTSQRVIVTSWFDFLRDSLTNEVVSDIIAGSILELYSQNQNNAYLILPDGRKGKLALDKIQDFDSWRNSTLPTNEKLVETAKIFMGTPYLWGGTSVKGIDCSGFIKSAFFLNGCIVARDASQQVLYGQDIPVDKTSEFQPGDLVFFGRKTQDKDPKVTHVGMYIGNSEFIHSSGRVRINSFDSTRTNFSHYRTISLLKVKRLISQTDQEGITLIKNHPWY